MPKLQRGSGYYYVTVPIDLVRKNKWKQGTRLTVSDGGENKVVVEKL